MIFPFRDKLKPLTMENSPFNTNNPYKNTPKSQSTLPLEPRVPREQLEEQEKYMPRPPRPEDAPDASAAADKPQQPATAPAPRPQDGRRQAPRATVNFPAQPGPRVYETPESYAGNPPEPRPQSSLRPRPTVAYQPEEPIAPQGSGAMGSVPEPPRQQPLQPQQPPRQPQHAAPYRPTVKAEGGRAPQPTVVGEMGQATVAANGGNAGGYPPPPSPRYPAQQAGETRQKSNLGLIIGIAVAALLIIGAGCWWYFGYRNSHPLVMEEEVEEMTGVEFSDNTPSAGIPQANDAVSGEAAATAAEEPGVGSATESTSLFNRPLTYTGTVTPGGVATLNVILFQNGRLEGSVDYADGKSMPLFGSYTWTDNGHMMNINFTVSSKSDKTYSESWMGHSSYIKDDLAHTLTFGRISTSSGQSMTASFALRQ